MGPSKRFADMKIKFKLIAAFLSVTVLFAVVAGIYQFANHSIVDGYDFAIDKPIGGAFRLYEAKLQLAQTLTNTEKYKQCGVSETVR